jgi:hypothetical protein
MPIFNLLSKTVARVLVLHSSLLHSSLLRLFYYASLQSCSITYHVLLHAIFGRWALAACSAQALRVLAGDRSASVLLPVIGHRTSDIGHRTSDIGHRTSDIGHRTSDIGHRTSDIGHRTSDIPVPVPGTYRYSHLRSSSFFIHLNLSGYR